VRVNPPAQFKCGGLKTAQTPINYRGVQIGQVTAVELSQDHQAVAVKARLQRSAASIAREGSVFWIVRPEVGIGNITGLGSVIIGPEINVLPGKGKEQSEFVGLEKAPVALEEKGLRIILVTGRLGSLRPGSPIYYRGIEVGAVIESQLSPNAAAVQIHAFIKHRYTKLVRNGSKFWNLSGMDVNFSLFRGLEINMESLKSLAFGGIACAIPADSKDSPAKDGSSFPLHHKPAKEWLEWAPKIQLVTAKQSSEKDLRPKPVVQQAH
jgi:paraquat-inducible protein B